MSAEFVLVAGPLVRASSWEPTARHLRAAGCSVQLPDVLAHHATPPPWSAWTGHLLENIEPASDFILVGHSSASPLIAELALEVPARGLVIVDGEVPPVRGAASPVRPALRAFIHGLADAEGALPIWSRWFAADRERAALVGIDQLAGDQAAFAQFERGLPAMNVAWFDDTIHLTDWAHIPAGYIQTSDIYDHAAAEARRRGWPVTHLHGTHLDSTLRPHVTAEAILAMARRFGACS